MLRSRGKLWCLRTSIIVAALLEKLDGLSNTIHADNKLTTLVKERGLCSWSHSAAMDDFHLVQILESNLETSILSVQGS